MEANPVEEVQEPKASSTRCTAPTEVELTFEAGGNEYCVFEGDSILIDMLTCPDRAIDWTHGGQFLHLLWTIEEFLNTLLISGIRFDVIFFDCHIALWKDHPAVLCFRKLLISHLKHNTAIRVHQLPHWRGKKSLFFSNFLAANIAFIGLSDGENATLTAFQKQHLQSFYHFCSRSTTCAFISSITMCRGRLIGFIVKQHRCKIRNSSVNIVQDANAMKEQSKAIGSPLKVSKDQVKNWTEWMTYNACICLFNEANEEEKMNYIELMKIMIIHSHLIRSLPLRCRSLRFKIHSDTSIIQKFLTSYFCVINIIMASNPTTEYHKVDKFMDFFDGRLFYALLIYFTDTEYALEQLFETEEIHKMRCDWELIDSMCGNSLGSFTTPRITLIRGGFYPTEDTGDAFLFKCHSDVKSLVIKTNIGIEGKNHQIPRQIKLFIENKHWHSNKHIEERLLGDKTFERGNIEYTRRFYKFIEEYASSLEVRSYVLARKQGVHIASDGPNDTLPSELVPPEDVPDSWEDICINEIDKPWEFTKELIKAETEIKRKIKMLEGQVAIDGPLATKKEARFMLLENYLIQYVGHTSRPQKDSTKTINLKVLMLHLVHKILNTYSGDMTAKETRIIVEAMSTMNFHDTALLLAHEFEVPSPKPPEQYSESSIRFQLQHMGSSLKRKHDSEFDDRVNFKPDAWQRDLINIVDKSGSALIVAPTSAGKTFISYYCMKKILEESSDGIVVYIAPTKALVNQVSAEVYSRFKNECSQLEEGTSLFGIFTRDIRFNPLSCRVLVTVPQCLEILLLSPTHQKWCNNIKYVVFDEVHTIADRGSGEVWEHLFSLINCPFLALSATIDNTIPLCDWLQSKLNQQKRKQTTEGAAQAKDLKLSLIQYNQRYSDLAYYHYSDESLHDVHPYSLLTVDKICAEGFPADMQLQPSDIVALYDRLDKKKEVFSDSLQEKLTALHHDNIEEFKSGRQLLKSDVRRWQGELQSFICSVIAAGHGSLIDKILNRLGSADINPNYIPRGIFQLVCKLRDKNMLPAIVFCFDRKICESLADQVLLALAQRKEPPNDTGLFDNGVLKINSELTFSDRNSIAELLEITKGLDLNKKQIEYLQRGIGVHHSGMDVNNKFLVERLFRIKAIQVVFATSTLAQGINMPCKTVVLAKDSIYLNTLSFRQTSGRAGRRGYDKLGNVVFFGIPRTKLTRLIASDLPLITSNFPISTSLVLRSFMLYKDSQDREGAIRKITSLYSQPLGSAFNTDQVQILFRFAMEYLMEENLLDKDGSPLGLAGLAGHIYWSEPANLLLVSLIQRSIFHRICNDVHLNPKQKQQLILIVLSNIFQPLELHKSVNIDDNAIKDSKSTVILESPPDFVIEAIEHHNTSLLNVFLNFCNSVLNGKDELPSIELPLSNVQYNVNPLWTKVTPLNAFFSYTSNNNRVISPFAGLSGQCDNDPFNSLKGLVLAISKEIPIDLGMLPFFKYSPTARLNRYIIDFFEHGDMKALVTANGLRPGDDYELTKTFSLLLKSIYYAMKRIAPRNDSFLLNIGFLMKDFEKKFRPQAAEREIRI